MKTLVFIALGGAVGALCRYEFGRWIHSWAGSGFPWGTFSVNLAGSFALGFALRLIEHLAFTDAVRGLVALGFLGAFTTFSTFSYETALLINSGRWERATVYSLGSVLLGLVGVLAGLALAAGVLQQRT